MAKSKKVTVPETNDLIDRCLCMASKALSKLDVCVDRISKKLDEADEYDVKDASHLAWVMAQIVKQIGELRKLNDQDERAIKNMKPSEREKLLKAWFVEQPNKVKKQFIEFLQSELKQESVL